MEPLSDEHQRHKLEAFNSSALKVRQQKAMVQLRRLFWLYLVLLIFEGALRKWVMPQFSAPLLIVRDPVVLLMYWIAFEHRLFPGEIFVRHLIFLAACSLFLALVQYISLGIPVKVLVFGLRTNFLHLPLIFLLPKILRAEDLRKIGFWILILAIPMALLMGYQFRSTPDARINRIAGLGEGAQLFSASGKIRPSGTFSFITGPVAYFALVTAFLGYALTVARESFPRWLAIGAGVALGLAVSVSGSRATMLSGGLVIVAWIIGMGAAGQMARGVTRMLVVGMIVFFVLGQVELFQEGTEVFSERWELASGAEKSQGGLVGRVLDNLISPLRGMFGVPAIGFGLGVGTNVGAALMTGRAQFLLSEGEWGRVLMEMGPLLGLTFILYRIALTVWLGKLSIRAAATGNILPLTLFSACAVNVFNGQIAQATILGFTVLGAGLALAALNLPPPAPETLAKFVRKSKRAGLARAPKNKTIR
jgi:hypothetical protein